MVMKDRDGLPRNFGFIAYNDEASFNHCLEEKPHTLDGKLVRKSEGKKVKRNSGYVVERRIEE